MGPGISRASDVVFAKNEIFQRYTNNVFDVGLDEIAFSKEFTSKLFQERKTPSQIKVKLPGENLIVDIVSNPLLFTQAQTPSEAFISVITPIFTSSEMTQSTMHHILSEFFTFLSTKPDNILIADEEVYNSLMHQQKNENEQLSKILMKHAERTPINIQEMKSVVQNVTKFLNILQSTEISNYTFNPNYQEITNLLREQSAVPQILWGLTIGDSTAIIEGLSKILSLSSSKIDSKLKFKMSNIENCIKHLSFSSTITLPFDSTIIGTVSIPQSKSQGMKPSSIISSDGRTIFLLGHHCTLHIIKLSDTFTNIESRFHKLDLKIPKEERLNLSLCVSNGHIIINGPFLKHPKIIKIQSLQDIQDIKFSHKIHGRTVSDGHYMYFYHKKKIRILSLNKQNVHVERIIEPYFEGTTLLNPFSKELLPDPWEDTALFYASGTSLVFLVQIKNNGTKCDYFSRSFSLIDGKHLGDLVFSLKLPIVAITSDPWNNCLWAISPGPQNLFLVKLHKLGSKAEWLTGLNGEEFPTFSSVIKSIKKVKNIPTLVKASTRFLEYVTANSVGIQLKTLLLTKYFNTDIAHFLIPCTEQMLTALVKCISAVCETINAKNDKRNLFKSNQNDVFLISLIGLLQLNLANICARNMADKIQRNTLNEIIDLLSSLYNNEKYSFAKQIISYTIGTSFPLLFSDYDPEKRANIFKTIIYQQNSDFIFYILRLLQKQRFFIQCFTDKTCHEIISPLIEILISTPHKMTQSQNEMLVLFQRNLMISARKLYTDFPKSIPEDKKFLQNILFEYCKMMSERFAKVIDDVMAQYNENSLKFSNFVQLFRKWLLLLQPLSKFSRISCKIVYFLQPIFVKTSELIKIANLNNVYNNDHSSFVFLYSLFFEIFTIIIEFVIALINGGNELNNADNYLWLVRGTLETNITLESFPQKYDLIFSPKSSDESRKELIQIGLEDDPEKVKFLLTSLDPQYILENENLIISIFNRQNKAIAKHKHNDIMLNDILFLFAAAKQLDLLDELIVFSAAKKENRESQMTLKFKELTHAVNELHRTQYQIKQSLIAGSEEELSKKLSDIRHKIVFLLMISPLSKTQDKDILNVFHKFINDDFTIEHSLQMISDIQRVKENITLGIDIIADILNRNLNIDFVSFMLDKIIRSESFMKYVSFIGSMKLDKDRNGFGNIFKLLDLLRKIMPSVDSPVVLNLMIVFYSNLLMMVGKYNPSSILEPISELFDLLLSKNISIEETSLESYIAILACNMFAIIHDSENKISKEDSEILLKKLFKEKILNISKLSLARLCLRSGMILPYKEKMILHFIKHIQPAVFHNAFSFLFEYIKSSNKKMELVSWLLCEISAIASGGRPQIMRDFTPLAEIQENTKMVKTPGILMIACAAMIRVIRFCITAKTEAAEIVHSIFTFILQYNNCNGFNINVPEEMKQFTDKRYLFGVFAVLSNSISIPNVFSLIKDNSTNVVYYLTDIDPKNQQYFGWQTPITPNNHIETIPYSPSIVPKSVIPFTPDMYPDYEHLMPFFTRALNEDPDSYFTEALNFYILQSLKEYITDHKFLLSFMETGTKFQIKKFSLHNYSKDFIRILSAHLSSNSLGFLQQPSFRPHLLYCAMTGVPDNKLVNVTDNHLFTYKGAHCFLSDPLSPENSTYLHLDFHKKSAFHVGIHMFSLHYSSSQTFMLSSNGSALYNGLPIDTVPSIYGFNDVTLCYEPSACTLSIYDHNTHIFTFKIPSGAASFLIHTFGSVEVSYSINNIGPKMIESTVSAKICSNIPTGKNIFTRNKRTKGNVKDLVNKLPFQQSNPLKIKLTKPKLQRLTEDPNSFFFTYDARTQPIISYPAELLKNCRTELNLENVDKFKKQILTYPSECFTHTSNAGTPSKIPVCQYCSAFNRCSISTFPLDFKPVFINDNTGEVTEVEGVQTTNITLFQPIHTITYPCLPSEILNFFTTGYVYETRKDIQTHIFLQALSIVNFPKSKAIEIFDLEMPNLLEIVLMLAMHIEPINPDIIAKKDCPINFTIDATSPNYHITGPKYVFKQGINVIYQYVEESELIPIFAHIWKSFLLQQFTNFYMHFIRPLQPNAVITQISALTETRTIIKPSAIGYIVFRAGFNSDGSLKVADKEGRETILTKGLVYVEGFVVKISRIDATGDGVICLPVNPGTNETFFGSFFELVLSLKYFTYYITRYSNFIEISDLHDFRAMIYTNFIDSYIANSPFFSSFGPNILEFLCDICPLISIDLVGDLVVHLSLLSIYTNKKNHPIMTFLTDQQTQFREKIYIPLKKNFPEFLTPAELSEYESIELTDWEMPKIQFPLYLENSSEKVNEFASQLVRLCKPITKKLTGFPFHLFLNQWAIATTKFIPYEITRLTDKTISVTISAKLNEHCIIKLYGNSTFNKYGKIFDPPASNNIFMGNNCKIIFSENIDKLQDMKFILVAEGFTESDLKEFVIQNREMFINDVRTIFAIFDYKYDKDIFEMVSLSKFAEQNFKLDINPEILAQSMIPYPTHIIYLRGLLLFSVCWMIYHNIFNCPENFIKYLCHFMPKELKVKRFMELIDAESNDDSIQLNFNRIGALEVWDGVFKDINCSILYQFHKKYQENVPKNFRKRGDSPFCVVFQDEKGKDSGGISKELILDAINESIIPSIGLFIQCPNSKFPNSENFDCLIPVPDPNNMHSEDMYKMLGVLFGISTRCGLTKPLPFPDFFWKYIAQGILTIEDIYSIDTPYKELMISLENNIQNITDEKVFSSRFSLFFVVKDSLGQERPLSEYGRTRPVTLQNVREYISLSKDFRIKELKSNLDIIRQGYWENLGLKPPPFVTGDIIRSCCSPPNELTAEAILSVTEFDHGLPKELKDLFIEILNEMNKSQLSLLLKFATARENLPFNPPSKPLLNICYMNDSAWRDGLPKARTCFGEFDMPIYTSKEIAKKKILLAIEISGTFENN
ncbi:hypothetical protein TVAG_445210 [Trichomonas vaginalis G3]|uniref:HECT domain-containing protein n=1 Tax=Trichomonas vaginalis (strain ATCC PRA-98 / G3) TaxID=412133 RepID=A2E4I7_TRIV3|nr:guanyl-nucleotide exchange factor protein [Trichomonas vaginalis G3]EAY12409.1 hypothetical protein TVAG_445210 [Trichomonas vaginalis G3]KAI5494172.1 guanyl-nucleotide exchange factor protein [Trichomonas vaginalis G3]|eukprot:XP_001324632.1 hypothetical protein [Trichomonas vaginalis G3]